MIKIQCSFLIKTVSKIENRRGELPKPEIGISTKKPVVNIGGDALNAFPLTSGTRQGCLQSAPLQEFIGNTGQCSKTRKIGMRIEKKQNILHR